MIDIEKRPITVIRNANTVVAVNFPSQYADFLINPVSGKFVNPDNRRAVHVIIYDLKRVNLDILRTFVSLSDRRNRVFIHPTDDEAYSAIKAAFKGWSRRYFCIKRDILKNGKFEIRVPAFYTYTFYGDRIRVVYDNPVTDQRSDRECAMRL